jgi:hypothetical protein
MGHQSHPILPHGFFVLARTPFPGLTGKKMKQTQRFSVSRFTWGRGMLRLFLAILIIAGLAGTPNSSGTARENGNVRTLTEHVTVQGSHWQLLRWSDGFVTCNIYVNHTAQPSIADVTHSCGTHIAETWLTTPACIPAQNGGSSNVCSGLMLRYVGAYTQTTTRVINLPEISIRLQMTDCLPGQWCENRPGLRLIAQEPVEGHSIANIGVRVANNERIVRGSISEIRLPPTSEKGEWLEYWAESDFGDSSQRFRIKYRAYSSVQDGRQVYRFDLLTQEWADTLPGGALLWQVFAPVSESLPKLLEPPLSPGYLATTNRYALLAGQLIRNGLVDATACADRGILPNGAASICGEQAAAEEVLAWQNKYDAQIYEAGLRHRVPARLLKGVIAQESQFWPESPDPYERGLGFITENGVTLLLIWNPEYFLGACLPVYGEAGCAAGYSNMRPDRQVIIRRVIFDRIGSDSEIDMIAATLYASAAQTQQMVRNVLRSEVSEASTYEDMWKMSLANYYAGSGCVGNALRGSINEPFPVNWETIANYLEGTCTIAATYVERVIQYSDR